MSDHKKDMYEGIGCLFIALAIAVILFTCKYLDKA